MKLAAVTLLTSLNFILPQAIAQEQQPTRLEPDSVPAETNAVIEACIRGEAETLPIPFSDLSADHWAFTAVMTMHYCGVYRPPVPAAVIRQLLINPAQERPAQGSTSLSVPQVNSMNLKGGMAHTSGSFTGPKI